MGEFNRDQFSFSQGEIDPKTQSRTDWAGWYKSAKKLRDMLAIPQGGFTGRWGTNFVDVASIVQNNPLYCEISTLIYDDSEIYLLVWEVLSLKIYLENKLIATVVTTYNQEDIPNLRFQTLQNRLIIVNPLFPQRQLVRSANAANVITGVDLPNNGLTITNALIVGDIYPTTFTTTGVLPLTNPQVYQDVTYYVKPYTTNSVQIFSTTADAVSGINFYIVANVGVGVNSLLVQNTWTLSNITFINVPAYDFNSGYSAITFTPSGTTGNITLTASANIFTAAMVGGVFSGNGGVLRITVFTDATHVNGFVVEPFASTAAIQGSLSFLGEPAWSAARGYPRAVSAFQERLFFGGTRTINNGVWGSNVNAVYDFDDSETLADSAISWYPATDGANFVRSMTSGQTLLVHTNTGTLSTPYGGLEQFLSPTNFVLTTKSKFGVSPIQPIFIDNQIMFVDRSGNNVINLVWSIDQGSFVTNNISVASSSLIVSPIDMASFAQPNATDGFYALFINSDGTLANYQTLLEQNVGAWSLMKATSSLLNDRNTNYTVTPNQFIRVTTAIDRCWFTIQRVIPVPGAPTAITAFDGGANTLTAGGALNEDEVQLINFTAVVPVTVPPIAVGQFYFGRGITISTFAIYSSKADADADINRYVISSAGVGSTVISNDLTNRLYIEELSFSPKTDSSVSYKFDVPTNTLTGLSHLNGCVVQVFGDGYVLANQLVFNGSITIEREVSIATVGLQFIPEFIPLPPIVPQVDGLLYKQKHIKTIYIRYHESLGVQVDGVDIPMDVMQDVILGVPPPLQSGTYVCSPMKAWDLDDNVITITQPLPLPITILGLSYVVET